MAILLEDADRPGGHLSKKQDLQAQRGQQNCQGVLEHQEQMPNLQEIADAQGHSWMEQCPALNGSGRLYEGDGGSGVPAHSAGCSGKVAIAHKARSSSSREMHSSGMPRKFASMLVKENWDEDLPYNTSITVTFHRMYENTIVSFEGALQLPEGLNTQDLLQLVPPVRPDKPPEMHLRWQDRMSAAGLKMEHWATVVQ